MSQTSVNRQLPCFYAWHQTPSPHMFVVIPFEYVDEPYIAKTRVNWLSSCKDGIILRQFILSQYRV